MSTLGKTIRSSLCCPNTTVLCTVFRKQGFSDLSTDNPFSTCALNLLLESGTFQHTPSVRIGWLDPLWCVHTEWMTPSE